MKLLFELSFSNHRNRFVHFNNDLVVKFCFRETIETIAITPSPPLPPPKKNLPRSPTILGYDRKRVSRVLPTPCLSTGLTEATRC